jgi:hypothetical protein
MFYFILAGTEKSSIGLPNEKKEEYAFGGPLLVSFNLLLTARYI